MKRSFSSKSKTDDEEEQNSSNGDEEDEVKEDEKMFGKRFSSSWSSSLGNSTTSKANGPCRVGFIGVARDRTLLVWARDAAEMEKNIVLSERYAALGRKIATRSDPPGWDDIGEKDADRGGNIRAIKLPVCDMKGTTSYIVCFGSNYSLVKAQSLCERLALMLGPMVDIELQNSGDTNLKKFSPNGAADVRSVLEREIAQANSNAALQRVANQVEEVRAIMERNVEMILDRGEKIDQLNAKSDQLSEATQAFKKQARKLKRWHLMNQVKWGVAVGTLVTASVAIPIAMIAVA